MKKKSEVKKTAGPKCACPYCEEEVVATAPTFCKPCGVTLRYCVKCHIAVDKAAKVCPKCGQPVK